MTGSNIRTKYTIIIRHKKVLLSYDNRTFGISSALWID